MSQLLQKIEVQLASVRIQPLLLSQIVVSEAANQRSPAGHTKTRAMVRGGGRKPWRQKGTGRARQGSTRSPQWVGGGSVFGPRPERNFSRRTTGQMRALAFQMAVAIAVRDQRLRVIDGNLLQSAQTTKQLVQALGDHFDPKQRNLLLVTSLEESAVRLGQNMAHLLIRPVQSIRVTDLLLANRVLAAEKTVTALINRTFGAKQKEDTIESEEKVAA